MNPIFCVLLRCRLFEWVTTFIMLGMAATIIVSPATIQAGAFRYMLVVGFTPIVLGMFFCVIGGVRIVALVVNGRSPVWGPRLRAVGALGGAFIWAWMALALLMLTRDTGTMSLGIFNWIGLTLGEVVSCARAGSDVRTKPDR
jgi:hypothetical protein